MKLRFIFLALLFAGSQLAFAQKEKTPEAPVSSEEQFEKKYQQRIKKEVLAGTYIPKDVAEAFVQLNKLIDTDSKTKYKTTEENIAVRKFSGGFGRWMIHNWGFYEGSRYSHHLRSMGIYHPEEMAKFTMLMYHRYLNKKKLNVKDYLEAFELEKAKKLEEKKKNQKVLKTFKRKRKKEN